MTKDFGGIAGIFAKALEDPKQRPFAAITLQLWMLHGEVLAELQEMGIPASVLTGGFDDPAFQRWSRSAAANQATRDRGFGVIFFGQQLQRAQEAFSRGDHLSAFETLCGYVKPPFHLKDSPGGRKRKMRPGLIAGLQEWAEIKWRRSPQKSVLQLSQDLEPVVAQIFLTMRIEGDPPKAETIRKYLKKPDWAKP